jgi:hypothetical protein
VDDRVDDLFQEWHLLGGAVLLAEVKPLARRRPPEDVIAESTSYCRSSGRLTWVVLDWLIRRIDEVDEELLLSRTVEVGEQSVLGVLCDAAYERNPHPKLAWVTRHCAPSDDSVPFFHRVARSPLATRLAEENAVAVFRRWNYLCGELRYLSDHSDGPFPHCR